MLILKLQPNFLSAIALRHMKERGNRDRSKGGWVLQNDNSHNSRPSYLMTLTSIQEEFNFQSSRIDSNTTA